MEKVPQQEPSRGEPGAEQEAQKAQEARSSNVDEHVHVGNSRMPAHTRRRLEYSLRTAWTTAICLTLIYYFAWSNIALSLSPVISVISAVLYFGQWQQAAVKVAYSSVVGAAIGVVVGFSYQTKPLFLVLFFFAMAWINRASKWDRTSMVLGSLALVLCALWPILTDGEYTGLRSFYSAIALINVPWLITGASLLFPFPALAIFSAKDQVLVVTRKMSLMLSALVRAFNEQDQADLFVAEYDELAVEMAEDFATLTQLTAHCSSEVILFPSARDLPPALCLLNETLRRIVCELDGLRDSVASIEHSRTQAKFSSLLRPVLADIAEETHLCATLVGDFFDTFRPIPGVIRRPLMWLWARLGGCCSCLKTHDLSRRSQRRVREIYGIQPSHVLLRRQFTRTSLSSKARNRSDSAPHTVYIDPDSFSHYSFSPSACHSCGMQEPPSMDVASLLPTGTASVFFDGGVGGELRGFGATTTTTDGADVDTETSLDKALGLDFLQSAARLLVLRSKMLHDYQEGRRRYIFIGEQGGGEGEGFGDGGGDGGEGKEERMDGPRLRTHRGRPTQGADEGGGGGAGGGVGAGIRAGADAGAGAGTGVDAGAGTGAGTEGGSRVRFGSSLDLQLEANLTAELTLAADVTLNPSPGGRGEEKSPKSPKRGDIGDIESASLGMQEWGREHLIVSALHEMHHLHTQSQQAQLSRPSLVERSVREETLRLSLRNFGPRAAYLHKLSVIVELVASYKDVFVQRGEAWSALGSVWAYTFAVLEYVLDTGAGFVSAGGKIMRGLTRQDVSVWYRDFRLRYTNACKIALAVTIAASLLVFDLAPGLYNGGLWTTIVIVLVRQDKTASSFLTGFQRLEGTVIGAIFSFVLYNFLKCDTTHCGPDRVITPIVAWVALCSLFR
ncbi:hypothetical protein B484DRAFT_401922 [Ochromonadaceae sp. CCMP2298]|nr:hypothetical protein B484DRAFT_401922 [Ochromonadaceae sp. CCMP2298]